MSEPKLSSSIPAPAQSNLPKTEESRLAAPVQLIIPAIHVDAPVEAVGMARDGAMDVPKRWNEAAWFEPGYRPGEHGNAVMVGHLDSTTGPALFWDLSKLKPGDVLRVKADDRSQRSFAVISSEHYRFDHMPLERIFGASPAPMLNLITCNGTFDLGARNYDQRLVVYTRESTETRELPTPSTSGDSARASR